ncbi:MAG: glycosyltransferase [Mariprofundales bacterium]
MQIIIPCFDEPDIITVLNSITLCTIPDNEIVIIILVLNYPQVASEQARHRHEDCLQQASQFKDNITNQSIQLHIINMPAITNKYAGVGLARKTGMDAAINLLAKKSKDNILLSLDADCHVSDDYLSACANHFIKHPKHVAAVFNFSHQLPEKKYPRHRQAMADYELYLRYNIQGNRYAECPYLFHTIGSCFAVRASAYQACGGMNKRKAGEDFYFLHKIANHGTIGEVENAYVYPSARFSNRTPFGTGVALSQRINKNAVSLVHHPKIYDWLKSWFGQLSAIFAKQYIQYHPILWQYLEQQKWQQELQEIRANTASFASFKKRFFVWFSALRLRQFINFAIDNGLEKISQKKAAILLLEMQSQTISAKQPYEVETVLQKYRQLQFYHS